MFADSGGQRHLAKHEVGQDVAHDEEAELCSGGAAAALETIVWSQMQIRASQSGVCVELTVPGKYRGQHSRSKVLHNFKHKCCRVNRSVTMADPAASHY